MSREYKMYELMRRNPETGQYDIHCPEYDQVELTTEDLANYTEMQFYNLSKCYYQLLDLKEGSEYKLARWRNINWRNRENGRLASREYTKLPWSSLEPITDHFAHVSIDNGVMVAYTPDASKGELDIQVKTKPGRYLAKFYPHLSNDEVRDLATQLDKATSVQFAKTADDIETVYRNGPSSCMAYDIGSYSSDTHPVRVYAGPDLQLAYLAELPLGHARFRASARCIVWPEKKFYTRIYGDTHRLRPALEELGYKPGSLNGARLTLVEERSVRRIVCPYIDNHSCVAKVDGYLVINDDADYEHTYGCQGTNGYVEDEGEWCPGLRQYVSRDELFYYVQDRDENCSETYVNERCFYCDGYGEYFSDASDSVELLDTGETVSLLWAHIRGFQDEEGNYYRHRPNRDAADAEIKTSDVEPAKQPF